MAILAAINPYTEAADLILSLPVHTADWRNLHGWTVDAQAKAIGIGKTTLIKLEDGSVPTQTTILRVLRWLAANGAA